MRITAYVLQACRSSLLEWAAAVLVQPSSWFYVHFHPPKSSSFYSVLKDKVQGLKSSLSWHLNYSCPFLLPALVLISYFKLKKYNGQEPEEQRKVLFFRLSLSESLSAPLQAHAVCYLHLVKTSSDSYLWLLYCKSLFSLLLTSHPSNYL